MIRPDSKPLLTIFVEGRPYAQPRPRARVQGKHARVYQARGPALDWRKSIAGQVGVAWGRPPCECPVWVDAQFVFKRPRFHYGTGRNGKVIRPAAPEFHAKKPDIDNLDKLVLDALVDAGVLKDDAAVVGGTRTKRYCGAQEREGVYLTIARARLDVAA